MARRIMTFAGASGGTAPRAVVSAIPAAPAPLKAPSGTTAEVLEWVGDDVERAEVALAAEESHSEPRKTLIANLHKIIEG